MKKLFNVALFAAGLFIAGQAHAQTHRDTTLGHKISKSAKKVGHETSEAAKEVGHGTAKAAKAVGKKTSEVAAKGAAAVTDRKYEGKMGPNGETIYINNKAQYYYVNKSGHRVYVTKIQLKNKP